MSRKIVLSTLLLVSPFPSVTAMAQDADVPKGLYLGGAITQSRFDDPGSATFTDIDNTNNSWKVIGGWRLHENFAVEASYIDFGELSAIIPASTPIPLSEEAKGFSVFRTASPASRKSVLPSTHEVVGTRHVEPSG